MRHRIANLTGLGNSEPVELDNNIQLEKSEFWDSFLEDATLNFKTIENYGGFDFHLDKNGFTFGIEPSYQYDDLQIIHFDFKDKTNSYIRQGRAWGVYGTHCLTKLKRYGEYKTNSKFIRFIDKWFAKLVNQANIILNRK
jgi:hypothetical protein